MIKSIFVPAAALLACAASAAAAQTAAPAQQAPTRANIQQALAAQFKSADANGDGSLTKAEIATAESKVYQQRIAALRAQAEGEFTRLDTNKDGQLSKSEFMVVTADLKAPATDGTAALTALDTNKDQKVSLAEYSARLLGQFDAADTNKDGTLSQAEAQAAQGARRR